MHVECELGFRNFSQPPARGSFHPPQHKTRSKKKPSSPATVSTKNVDSHLVEGKALDHMVPVQSQHTNPSSSDTIQKAGLSTMLNKLSRDLELSESHRNTLESFWEVILHTLQGVDNSSSLNDPIIPPSCTFPELDSTI
jgi:hypothetical protein